MVSVLVYSPLFLSARYCRSHDHAKVKAADVGRQVVSNRIWVVVENFLAKFVFSVTPAYAAKLPHARTAHPMSSRAL